MTGGPSPAIDALVARLRQRSGFADDASAHARVVAHLAARAQELGLAESERCARLALDEPTEYARLEGALSPAETWLFRYPESFAPLRAAARRRGAAGTRALLLGCGGWCEPASVAAALVEDAPPGARIDVVASDRNPAVFAAPPRFAGLAVREGLPKWATRHFEERAGALEPTARVRAAIATVVGDALATLARVEGRFDAIYLRNVAIYLSKDARAAILAGIVPKLAPGGLFFVGHAEVVSIARECGLTPIDAPGAFALSAEKAAPRPTPRLAAPPPRVVAEPASASRRTQPARTTEAPVEAASRDGIDALRARAARAPGDAAAHAALGLALEAAGDSAGALASATRALYLDRRHEDALLLAARLADARGDRAEAERCRNRALRAHLERETRGDGASP
jgi:chemotaxis methyl-accepting protein methylase